MIDFRNSSYLATGSTAQQQVFRVLADSRILQTLHAFDPVVAGTFPLDIQVPGSDVDIICHCTDLPEFARFLDQHFNKENGFSLRQAEHLQPPAVIATFEMQGIPFEIFGQNKPVSEQLAYRHMVIEYALLQKFGETFRKEVIALKRAGMKTELAFCQLLGIEGDPYLGLLEVSL